MRHRKTALGLGALCALLFGALGAQSASAAVAGTTAFTCMPVIAGAQFSDAHCKTPTNGGVGFKHVEIPQDETTEVKGTNETTGGATEPAKLKTTLGGVGVTLTATSFIFTGHLFNKLDETSGKAKEHWVHITGKLHFTEATANKPGCKVFADENGTKGAEGTITSNELTASTTEQEHTFKVTPAEGNVLATFFIEGCENKAINGTYQLGGSVRTTEITGATAKFEHANTTAQETLWVNNPVNTAGIAGTITLKGRAKLSEETTPISFTTVET
jgi:hypothetical protein